MSLERRRLIAAALAAGVGIGWKLSPAGHIIDFASAEAAQPTEAQLSRALEQLGVDGSRVFTSQHTPITVTSRTSGQAWQLALDNIDFTAKSPRILRPKAVATIPYATGKPAHFSIDVAKIDEKNNLTNTPVPATGALASYLLLDRYYDNKIVNTALAVVELARSMSQAPIYPGEEFSYLSRANIEGLIDSQIPLDGYGISARKRVRMRAGGICSSVTTIAKMARVAEHRGLVDITHRKPHSVASLQYYFNPDDPTPGQIDATAYYPSVDFRFTNLTNMPLWVVPKMQIIADQNIPTRYNSLEHATGYLALSTTLQTAPPTHANVDAIATQLNAFRALRGI